MREEYLQLENIKYSKSVICTRCRDFCSIHFCNILPVFSTCNKVWT